MTRWQAHPAGMDRQVFLWGVEFARQFAEGMKAGRAEPYEPLRYFASGECVECRMGRFHVHELADYIAGERRDPPAFAVWAVAIAGGLVALTVAVLLFWAFMALAAVHP